MDYEIFCKSLFYCLFGVSMLFYYTELHPDILLILRRVFVSRPFWQAFRYHTFFSLFDSENSIKTVLLALKASLHFLSHCDSSLPTLFKLCATYFMSVPSIIPFPSASNSSPDTHFGFNSVFAASTSSSQFLSSFAVDSKRHHPPVLVSRRTKLEVLLSTFLGEPTTVFVIRKSYFSMANFFFSVLFRHLSWVADSSRSANLRVQPNREKIWFRCKTRMIVQSASCN